MAIDEKGEAVVANNGSRGVGGNSRQIEYLAEIEVAGRSFVGGMGIVPNPGDRDRQCKALLLGFGGHDFGGRGGVPDARDSSDRVTKLFGRKAANAWALKNKLLLVLIPQIYCWHLVSARS